MSGYLGGVAILVLGRLKTTQFKCGQLGQSPPKEFQLVFTLLILFSQVFVLFFQLQIMPRQLTTVWVSLLKEQTEKCIPG